MKKKLAAAVMIIAVVTQFCSAQELEFSGYFENQFFPQKIGDALKLQDYNKLRFELSSEVAENLSFNADYVYRTFHGATTFNLLDFMPAQYRMYDDTIPMENFSFEQKDENYLDNAYVTLYAERFTMRIGKQQLPWGTGYTWNPTDVFNVKNTIDPTYEKVGVNALKLEVPFSEEGLFTAIVSPESEWEKSTKAIQLKQHYFGFDLSTSFIEKTQQSFTDAILFNTPFFQTIEESRRLIGGDFSGELLGIGIWGEAAFNRMQRTKNYGQYLLGADFTLENGLYLTAEYYRNELGKSDKNRYTFGDWMRLFSDSGENLGQDYLFAGQRYPVAELWNWSNFVLFNLNDKSGIIFPWFDYSFNDNTEMIFVGYLPLGKEGSEFGEFGYGGFARVRVYF